MAKVYGIKSNEEERFERSGVMNFIAYCHPDTSTVSAQTNKQTFSQFIFERCPTKPEWIQLPIMESHL